MDAAEVASAEGRDTPQAGPGRMALPDSVRRDYEHSGTVSSASVILGLTAALGITTVAVHAMRP